jgi:8-oxo-dGTP pyrophosphatase MutT (NUDIX family)
MIIERRAARVLLLAGRSVLLIKGTDPARPEEGSWWLTPGGGIDADESLESAAVREVFEETGLQLDEDWFFAVEVPAFAPRAHGWDDLERRSLLDQRWWGVDDLLRTGETIYPSELAELVAAAVEGEIKEPIALSGL